MTEEFASTRFDVKVLDLPLRDDDFDALEEMLGAGSESGGPMGVSTLHGFFAALLAGPRVAPREWMPLVWRGGTEFAETNRAMELMHQPGFGPA